jgi:prevent-host-death family protein
MRSVNIHEAKTHLSRLVEEAAKGEPFIIAKAGKPMVKVVPLEPAQPAEKPIRRVLGFMKGEFTLPDDLDALDEEIVRLFNDGPIEP